jgi:phage host-nuclease inhibitor protein Gam
MRPNHHPNSPPTPPPGRASLSPRNPTPHIPATATIDTLTAEIASLKNQHRIHSAELDAALHDLRRRYAQILAGLDTQIAVRMQRARAWAEANPSEFGAGKSIELAHAVIGYRTGQPQLKPLAGVHWRRILRRLKSLPHTACLVRVKEEVNQQRILLQRHQLGPDGLRQLGLRVFQEESFFVEPKFAKPEVRRTLAA